MDRSMAERMIQAGDDATERLNELLRTAEGLVSPDEFEVMRRAVATIVVEIQMDVLRPVHARYPELDRFGYFRRAP